MSEDKTEVSTAVTNETIQGTIEGEIVPGVTNEMVAYKDVDSEEKQRIDALMKEIDIADANSVIFFGSKAQEKVTEISDKMLEGVKNKDLGKSGEALNEMVATIRGFDIDELDAKSIVIEGLMTNKSQDEMERFILHGEVGKSQFKYAIPRPKMYGGYRVSLTMFATTSLGREIIVQLPPQAFVIPKPIEVNPALAVSEADLKAASEAEAAKLLEEEERFNWMLWIIGGILFLVIAAIATLFGIKYWQRKKFEKAIAEQTPLPPEDTGEIVTAEAPIEDDLDLNSLNEPESK